MNALDSGIMATLSAPSRDPGPCVTCGDPTARLCDICGEAFVCDGLCNDVCMLPPGHLVACGSHVRSSADDLKTAALDVSRPALGHPGNGRTHARPFSLPPTHAR